MTFSEVLLKESGSVVSEGKVDDSLVDRVSFTIEQGERSSRIPNTTENRRADASETEQSETPKEDRIAFKEVDDKFVQWIGRVLEIHGDFFTARIDPIRQISTSKIAKFNIRKVELVNVDQLEEGATFYWTVGLFRNAKGSFVKRSEVRFRFPIIPNKQAVDELALIKAKELFDGIGWLE